MIRSLWHNLTALRPHNGPRVRIKELLLAPKGSNQHGRCGRCSYQGCIWLTERHGALGHWIWTAQSIQRRLAEYFSLSRIIYNFNALDYSKIDDVEVDGMDGRDAPDFCDAFICSASYDGRAMTDEELDILNDDSQYVYDCVIEHLY